METSYSSFDFAASRSRMDAILDAPSGAFEEKDSLPSRDDLTYTNGVYANCAAIFIDIRDSSGLTEHYKRPRLARIYRTFISEMVADFKSHVKVKEISIVGDCVWAVVDSPYKSDLDDLFSVACRAHSLIDVINHKITKRGYDRSLAVGIGLDYGRALMIKAGYSGSGINEVVYMGDVVNSAAHLAANAHSAKYGEYAIHLSSVLQSNLSDDHKALCTKLFPHYGSDAVNIQIRDWLNEQ